MEPWLHQLHGRCGYETVQNAVDRSSSTRPLAEGLDVGSGLPDPHAAAAKNVRNDADTLALIARAIKGVRQPNFNASVGIYGDATNYLYYKSAGGRKTHHRHCGGQINEKLYWNTYMKVISGVSPQLTLENLGANSA